jgi:hypothetical protein
VATRKRGALRRAALSTKALARTFSMLSLKPRAPQPPPPPRKPRAKRTTRAAAAARGARAKLSGYAYLIT